MRYQYLAIKIDGDRSYIKFSKSSGNYDIGNGYTVDEEKAKRIRELVTSIRRRGYARNFTYDGEHKNGKPRWFYWWRKP